MSRLPLRLAGRLWAVLLVLTVALSALAPGAALVGMRSGSAFSVDTVEMAVAPARPQVAVARLEALPPMPLVPAVALVLVVLAPLALARAPHILPRSTGPPLATLPLRAPGTPRAPPHA
ncbi:MULTISPECIES: hypothetical protein [unclassified Novosphingobium]|uniref:hypothetical protein n=1 Tax=unclassified Novosphingobium TaxID=2644732 RepID=UPI00146BDC45|nr:MULTISPECIES: hypothetical protein [unclassified Novosphingobium]NMN89327.1 hypothetical protein [Novosphingobium sp. SG916]